MMSRSSRLNNNDHATYDNNYNYNNNNNNSTITATATATATAGRSRFYLWFLGLSLLIAVATIFQSTLVLHQSHYYNNELPSSSSSSSSSQQQQDLQPLPVLPLLPLLPPTPTINNRAVFYNIYIPDGEYKQHALGIVKDQLEKKQASTYLASVPLYYTLIGNNATDEIQRLCMRRRDNNNNNNNNGGGGDCHQLRHVATGDEGLTLQSVYDYCQRHPQDQVTYIHNKGSFHPSERNDKFRALIDKGVFSDECQTMPKDTCNVCAARFSAFPHYHMAGNFFTAHCSYVQYLLPPSRIFVPKMEQLFNWILLTKRQDIPRPTFKQYQDEYPVGRLRFAYEHWLCSHPFVEPCDVYPRKYTHGYRDLPSLKSYWRPRLASAPRFNMSIFLQISMLRGEWFCGQARLLEYEYLYGLQPKPTHFLWKYYLEPYKGCETPLNRTLHQDMFAKHVWDKA